MFQVKISYGEDLVMRKANKATASVKLTFDCGTQAIQCKEIKSFHKL